MPHYQRIGTAHRVAGVILFTGRLTRHERPEMTGRTTTLIQEADGIARFPVFAPRDDMQNWLHLYDPAVLTALAIYFSELPNTVVASEVPVGPDLSNRNDIRIPDLLVAFDCDRDLIEERRGYPLELLGRPPDFVLEVASPSTGVRDYTDNRLDYARYGIPEYWRFDPSGGDFYGVGLAGDRLVDGEYEPIEVEQLGEGAWRGYSEVLGLHVCWEQGRLRFFDSVNEVYLLSHQEEAARAEAEAQGRRDAVARADNAEAERSREAAARLDAEAEVRQLRARLEELGEGR